MDADLYELMRYYYDARCFDEESGDFVIDPVLGEEKNSLIASLAYILAKRPVVINGWAGTGKSKIANATVSLIPQKRLHIMQSGSEKSAWDAEKAITRASYIYLTEFQKTKGSDLVEIFKDWGEGKSAKYSRTEITMPKDGDQTRKKKLPCRPFLTTLALENDAEIGAELGRRVITLTTRTDQKHTQSVVMRKLEDSAKRGDHISGFTDEEFNNLRRHFEKIMISTEIPVVIPGAEALYDYIPTTFRIVMSQTDYLLDFIAAVARFNSLNRMKVEDPRRLAAIIATPEDIYCAWIIFGPMFIDYCLKITHEMRTVLEVMKTSANTSQQTFNIVDDNIPTVSQREIQGRLKEHDLSYTPKELKKMLTEMTMVGYLGTRVPEGKKAPEYYMEDIAQMLVRDADINMEILVKASIKSIKQEYPEAANKYIRDHCNHIEFRDPFTGELREFDFDEKHEEIEKKRGGIE